MIDFLVAFEHRAILFFHRVGDFRRLGRLIRARKKLWPGQASVVRRASRKPRRDYNRADDADHDEQVPQDRSPSLALAGECVPHAFEQRKSPNR